MKDKVAIIADDFTGSNDTGVHFSKDGFTTVVVFDIEKIENIDEKIDVVVVDTESRADDPKIAYEKAYKAAEKLNEKSFKYIYKKLDSTLRGNIGSEIDGVMDGGKFDLAIVAPALPDNGRKTIGGIQFVHDIPLEKTEIANDPITPIKHSYIKDIISEQCEKSVGLINLKDVLKGKNNLKEKMNEEIKNKKEIIIIDAITKEDLKTIAETINSLDLKTLLVGSAGLAETLPETFNLKTNKNKEATNDSIIAGIVGSVSDVTREQVKYANENDDNINVLDINIENVVSGKEKKEINRLKKLIDNSINEKKDIIIRSAKERKLVEKAISIGEKNNLNQKEVSKTIAKFMGMMAKELYNLDDVKGLFITGGDIAIQSASTICAQFNIIKEEVLPGIPLSVFSGKELSKKPVVTKAGAFGNEKSIIEVFKYLRKWSNNE
ncbi:hypothetical protein HSACCH_00959 [Halanaerobium saccharolyticum subsp. saccharolyticum DSM 6643]|uniref:Four-carbon acid sugar kinase family protein n=1 Tax=Halanaerobium saccharolyticum subsp. saccharolyticum DSM 6643 TaxID=1293054 RepID=M5E043_9FIRM|nr:four-carbon acid sugar kinase family protein [Halanaerobium saccharolyticum]CCU78881.1 hypothetical protein HSACCH_00959 [Halanaerobium saccharolyticum subsp. saccharolyticum DSM 6643]